MRPTRRLDLVETAQLPAVPRTEQVRISPMRLVAMQSALRRDTAEQEQRILHSLLHCLFMKVVAYYHEHIGQPMPCDVRKALSRVHDASQGLFPDPSVLFLDLRAIQDCEAGKTHSKLVEAALESLFAR